MNKSPLNFKVAFVQMRVAPDNIRKNVAEIVQKIKKAKADGAKVVMFPELAVTGYMLGDRWENRDFLRAIDAANEEIRAASDGIVVIWGSVKTDWRKIGEDGRVRKYNAAFVAQNGQWVWVNRELQGWIPKTNLPKYRIFDDARHFYPAAQLAAELEMELFALLQPFVVTIDGRPVKIGVSICEDLWEDEYNTKPGAWYGRGHVDMIVDISQSPWTAGKWHAREGMLKRRVADAHCPILYVNNVGLQNNTKNLVWFDGNSTMFGKDGQCKWRAPQHEEGLYVVDLSVLEDSGDYAPAVSSRPSEIEEIFEAQIAARRAFYGGFPRVVTGLSGGIDSAVDGALNVIALGPAKMLFVNMPTEFNSKTTRSLAERCARNLGVEYRVSSIQKAYEAELEAHELMGDTNLPMLVKENIQARARGHRLASIAAAHKGVFTCNGNKTEVALNYFTLYGDGAGAAAFLADVWKGQIYELALLINRRAGRELIPQGIIDIVPSAELSADQNVDEGKGDPIFYPYHDKLLRSWVEGRLDPSEILRSYLSGTLEQTLGCAPGTVAKYFKTDAEFVANVRWAWTQYNIEYKRHQLPPVFIISRRAFGFDRRDTIADGYFNDNYNRLEGEILARAA